MGGLVGGMSAFKNFTLFLQKPSASSVYDIVRIFKRIVKMLLIITITLPGLLNKGGKNSLKSNKQQKKYTFLPFYVKILKLLCCDDACFM